MGYFNDPWDCPGLAHLLEHTLMRGSAEQLGLFELAQQFNAELFAFTGMYEIVFSAQVSAVHKNALEHALLSQIEAYQPSATVIDQEVKVICQEFSNGHLDPVKRIQEVVKTTCNHNHPYAKFASGNVHTFAMHKTGELQDKLHELRDSILPTLCGATNQAGYSTKCVPTEPTLFLAEHLQKIIYVVSDTSQHKVILSVQIAKSTIQKLESLSVFMWLMNHLPKEALPSKLAQLGIISNYSVAVGLELAEEITIDVSFFLAPSTPELLNQVCHDLLAYLSFQAKRSWDPELCTYICTAAQIYAQTHDSTSPFSTINKADLTTIFARFVINNVRVLSLSSQAIIPSDLSAYKTPYYGTEFYITPFTCPTAQQDKQYPDEAMSLMTPLNLPFMHSLSMTPAVPVLDEAISNINTARGSCVLIPDETPSFLFECYLSLSVDTGSALSSIARRIWGKQLNQHLQLRFAHYLSLGSSLRVNVHQTGLTLHIKTHQCLAEALYEECIGYIENFPSQSVWSFDLVQAIQAERSHLQQRKTISAMQQAFSHLRHLILAEAPIIEEQVTALDKITSVVLKQDMVQFIKRANAEYMLFGRIPTALAQRVKQRLTQAHATPEKDATNTLESEQKLLTQAQISLPYNETHKSVGSGTLSSCVVYWHAQNKTPKDVAYLLLLEQLIYQPTFALLRNELALGYDVGCKFITHNQHPGFCVYFEYTATQSTGEPSNDAKCASARADDCSQEDFLTLFNQGLSQHLLTFIPQNAEQWQRAKTALIQQLSLPYATPSALAKQYWIMLGRYGALDYYETMHEYIKQLSYADFYQYIAGVIQPNNQLTLHVKTKFEEL